MHPPLIAALTAAGLTLCTGASAWMPSRTATTPEAVERLIGLDRFSEAAVIARKFVADRLETVGRPTGLVASTWDPLLTACAGAARAGDERCVDWAADVLQSADDPARDVDADDIRPTLVQLARLLRSVHRFAEAEQAYRRILAIDERRAGRKSQDAANTDQAG